MLGMECFRRAGAHFFESYEANMNKCYSYTRTLYVRAFLRYVIRWYIMVIIFFFNLHYGSRAEFDLFFSKD